MEAGRQDAAEILPAAPTRRHPAPGGARIDGVVIDLGGVEAAAGDHLEAGRGVAGGGDAGGLDQPLLLEAVEGVGDAAAAEHLLGRQRETPAGAVAEVIVQLQ